MKKIDTIIFDMGGVLVDLDLEACKTAFKDDLGFMEIDDIIDACHQKGPWGEMEAGNISAEEFRDSILTRSYPGMSPEDVDKAVEKILVGIDPAKVRLLKRLSESYDIYMLSNNNPIAFAAAVKIFAEAGLELDRYFKKCYISYKMKMLKPSDKIFKDVVADIGKEPERMLFIDDSQINVDASIAAGLPAVFYSLGSDMASLLADVLNDPSLAKGGVSC